MVMGTIGYEEIRKGIANLLDFSGSTLMVHSSLSSFARQIEGGCEAVLSALFDALGKSGTLLMPTLSFSSVDEAHPVFDVRHTPSDCGKLTEVFRNREDTLRSMHVLSSAACWGYGADDFVSYHEDTPCSKKSPYGKLIENDGWVLFMGASLESNTLFHAAEEAVSPDYLKYKTIKNARIIDQFGYESIHDFRRYDCYQSGINRYLGNMETVFLEKKVLKTVKVADSIWNLISAKDNFLLCSQVLSQNPQLVLTKKS